MEQISLLAAFQAWTEKPLLGSLPAPLIFERNLLRIGEQLYKGDSLRLEARDLPSAAEEIRNWKHAELTMQQDGHLVLYATSDQNERIPIWTASGNGCFAELDRGQLVVRAKSCYGFVRAWCSDNWHVRGEYLLLEEHAGKPRIALYNHSNQVVWASDVNDGWWYDLNSWE